MEILLPTAEKQNEILTKVSDIQNKVAQGDSSSSGSIQKYLPIGSTNSTSIEANQRVLVYSIEGKGFLDKFVSTNGLKHIFEVYFDGKLYHQYTGTTFNGLIPRNEVYYNNGLAYNSHGVGLSINKTPSFPFISDVVESSTVFVDTPPIIFNKKVEIYITNLTTKSYTFNFHIRGGIYE